MPTMFKAFLSPFTPASITKVDIVRLVGDTVRLKMTDTTAEHVESRIGMYHGYFDTFDEAKGWMLNLLQLRTEELAQQVQKHADRIKQAESITEEDTDGRRRDGDPAPGLREPRLQAPGQ